MIWTEFVIGGKTYCCRHLSPSTYKTNIGGKDVEIQITYNNHCFTDEKENGPVLFNEGRRTRYWSQERYDASQDLPGIIAHALDSNAYCVPHYSGDNEQYHYIEAGDYAVFFNLNKPDNTEDQLKLKVVSAYPIEEWGKGAIPKGSPYKINYVFSLRLQGESVLDRKKQAQKKRR